MSTPFPGMDPYLERPGLWGEVHTRLMVAIADALAPRRRPTYFVGDALLKKSPALSEVPRTFRN